MQFVGKVVLITGTQQGIGRAMALEFAAHLLVAGGGACWTTGWHRRYLPMAVLFFEEVEIATVATSGFCGERQELRRGAIDVDEVR